MKATQHPAMKRKCLVIHLTGLPQFWRLRLARAGNSAQARAALRDELSRLVSDSRDVALLASARAAYSDLLQDEAGARAIRGKFKSEPAEDFLFN